MLNETNFRKFTLKMFVFVFQLLYVRTLAERQPLQICHQRPCFPLRNLHLTWSLPERLLWLHQWKCPFDSKNFWYCYFWVLFNWRVFCCLTEDWLLIRCDSSSSIGAAGSSMGFWGSGGDAGWSDPPRRASLFRRIWKKSSKSLNLEFWNFYQKVYQIEGRYSLLR